MADSDILQTGQIALHFNNAASAIQNMTAALNSLSRSSNAEKMLSRVTDTAKKLGETVSKVSQKVSNKQFDVIPQSHYDDIYKYYNALNSFGTEESSRALESLSGQFVNFSDVVNASMDRASKDAREKFNPSVFNGLQMMIGSFKDSGVDMSQIFNALANGASLQDTISELERCKEELDDLQRRYNELLDTPAGQNSTALKELQEEYLRLEESVQASRDKSGQEFVNYISSATGMDIDSYAFGKYDSDDRIVAYFDNLKSQIENGSMSVNEAISKAKTQYPSLFDIDSGSISTSSLQKIMADLDNLSVKITEIQEKMANLGTDIAKQQFANNLSSNPMFEGSSEEIQRIAQEGTGLTSVLQVLQTITQASGEATSSLSYVSDIVSKLSELGNVDPDNLYNLANALKNINSMSSLDIDSSQITKLYNGLEKLQELTNLNKLTDLSRINLQGFNGIKVSSTVSTNLISLIESMQQIDDTAITRLQNLANINLSNFSADNLKVSKSTVDNLKTLVDYNAQTDAKNAGLNGVAESVRTLVETLQANPSFRLDTTDAESKLDDVEKKTRNTKKNISDEVSVNVSGTRAVETFETLDATVQKYESKIDVLTSKSLESNTKYGSELIDTEPIDNALASLTEFQSRMTSATDVKNNWEEYISIIAQLDAQYDVLNQRIAENEAAAKAAAAVNKSNEIVVSKDQQKAYDTLQQTIQSYENVSSTYRKKGAEFGLNVNTESLDGFIQKLKDLSSSINTSEDMSNNFSQYSTIINQINGEVNLLKTSFEDLKASMRLNDTDIMKPTDVTGMIDKLKEIKKSLIGTDGKALAPDFVSQIEALQSKLESIRSDFSNGIVPSPTTVTDVNSDYSGILNLSASLNKEKAEVVSAVDQISKAIDNYRNKMTSNSMYLENNKSGMVFEGFADQVNDVNTMYKSFAENMRNNPLYFKTDQGIKDLSNLKSAMTGLDDTWKRTIADIKRQNMNSMSQSLLAQVNAYNTKFGDALQSKSADTYNKLQDLMSKMNAGTINNSQAASLFRQIKAEAEAAGVSVQTFGQKLQSALGGKLYNMAATMVWMKVRQVIRELFTNVKEVDQAMAQLQIVTGASGSEIQSAFRDASKAAQELGASVTDVMSSMETFSRLGYSISESLDLSKAATMLSNIADTTVDESTTGITSIIKGFGIDAGDVMTVADELTAVGQSYAISASELMEAFENGGSSLAAAGNSLEESMAIFAAGNASVQNAKSVGTTMKTMAARIRSSTAELDEMGEEYDDLVSSASKYREEIMALSGVDIMQDENTYKSTYQILLEIAQVWDRIDDASQAALLEDLAGKRGTNVALSIITNIEDLTGAYGTASDAAGTAAKANDIYMDTIQAKTDQLKASFQTMSADLLDSTLVKNIVDMVNLIVKAIDKLINSIGSLGTIGVGVTLSKLFKNFRQIPDEIGYISIAFQEAYVASREAGGAIAQNITAGFLGAFSYAPFLAAIAGLASVIAISKLAYQFSSEKRYDDAIESIDVYSDDQRELDNINDRLSEINARINEINSQNGLSLVDKAELDELQKEKELLLGNKALQEDNQEENRQKAYKDAEKFLQSRYRRKDMDGIFGTIVDMLNPAPSYDNVFEYAKDMFDTYNGLNKNPRVNLEIVYDRYLDAYNEIVEMSDIVFEVDPDGEAAQQINDFFQYVLTGKEIAKETEDAIDDLFKTSFAGNKSDIMEWANSDMSDEDFQSNIAGVSGLQDALDSAGISVEDFRAYMSYLAIVLADTTVASDDFAASVGEESVYLGQLSDAVSTLTDAYETLNQVSSDYAINGGLTAETTKSIIDALQDENYKKDKDGNGISYLEDTGKSLGDFLTVENGNLKLNTEAWNEYAESKYNALKADAVERIDYLKGQIINTDRPGFNGDTALIDSALEIKQLEGDVAAYDMYIDQIKNDTTSLFDTFDALSSQSDTFTSIFDAMEHGGASITEAMDWIKEVPELAGYLDELTSGTLDRGTLDSVLADHYSTALTQVTEKIAELTSKEGELTSTEQQTLTTCYALAQAYTELAESLGYATEYQRVVEKGMSNNTLLDDYANAVRARKELADSGEAMFGNVNLAGRKILDWDNSKTIEKNIAAMESYGETVDGLAGSYSTIFGGSMEIDGYQVIFTPITPDGTVIDQSTMQQYVSDMFSAGGNAEAIMQADAAGEQIGDAYVHGMIMGISSSNFDEAYDKAFDAMVKAEYAGEDVASALAESLKSSLSFEISVDDSKLVDAARRVIDRHNGGSLGEDIFSDFIAEFMQVYAEEAHNQSAEFYQAEIDAWNGIKEAARAAGKEVGQYVKDIIRGTTKTGKQLDYVKNSTKNLWKSSQFSDAKNDLMELAKGAGITAKDILDLAEDNELLSEFIDQTGISARYLAQIFEDLSANGDSALDGITADTIALDKLFSGMDDSINSANKALQDYQNSYDSWDFNDQYNGYKDVWDNTFESIYGQDYDSWADGNEPSKIGEHGADYWRGVQTLLGENYDSNNLEATDKKIQKIGSWFNQDDNGFTFLDEFVKDQSKIKGLADDTFASLDAEGNYKFSFNENDFAKIADYYGTTEEVIASMVQALGMFGDMASYTSDELKNVFKESALSIQDDSGDIIMSVQGVKAQLESLGLEDWQVKAVMDDLKANENVKLFDLDNASEAYNYVSGVVKALGGAEKQVHLDDFYDTMKRAGYSANEIKSMLSSDQFTSALEENGYKIVGVDGQELSAKVQSAMIDTYEANGRAKLPVDVTLNTANMSAEASKLAALLSEYSNSVNQYGIDSTQAAEAEQAVREYIDTLGEVPEEISTQFNIDSGEDVEAQTNALINKAGTEGANVAVTVDTTQLLQSINEAVTSLSDLFTNTGDNQITFSTNAEEIASELSALSDKLKEIAENSNINISIGGNTDNASPEADASNSNSTVVIDGDNSGAISAISAVSSALSGLISRAYTITISANVSSAFSAIDSVKSALNSLQDKTVNVTTNYSETHSGSSGTNHGGGGGSFGSEAFGSASAGGSALASGNWGIKKGGKTLVGELGPEIMVDPANMSWRTVGDNGAEFVDIPNNAIVFNHKQSEYLLKYGRINNRGRALASGTARATVGSLGKYPASTGKVWGSSSSSSSNSSSSSGGSGAVAEIPDKLDLIEILLDRIERRISHFETTAKSAYKSFAHRTIATIDEIAATREEIEAQEKAAKTYRNEASSLVSDVETKYGRYASAYGISTAMVEDYKSKLENGAFELLEIPQAYSEYVQPYIDKYKEYYEKALDAEDAVLDLHEKLGDLYKSLFDNVQTQFEYIMTGLENNQTALEGYISNVETVGGRVSEEFYKQLIANERATLLQQEKERQDLIEAMEYAMSSGEIEEYSEAWYEMNAAIDEVTMAIEESRSSVIEWQEAIRDLKWDEFDRMQSAISRLNDEAEFYLKLMDEEDAFDDNGAITSYGMAQIGLRVQEYDTYMAQADKYAKEIAELDEQLSSNPNNDKLLDRRNELLDAQRQAIQAAFDEKQALQDLAKEGVDAYLKSLDELIDKYRKARDNARDMFEYQRDVAKQVKEIAQLQRQYDVNRNNDTEEGRKTVQELRVKLQEAEQDLQDTQYEQFVSDVDDIIDDMRDELEETLNDRVDDIDALIVEFIGVANTNTSDIQKTLQQEGEAVGYKMSTSMSDIWSDFANDTFCVYGDNFLDAMAEIIGILNSINGGSSTESSAAAIIEMMRQNSKDYRDADDETKALLHKQNEDYAKQYEMITGDHLTYKGGAWYTSSGDRLYDTKGTTSNVVGGVSTLDLKQPTSIDTQIGELLAQGGSYTPQEITDNANGVIDTMKEAYDFAIATMQSLFPQYASYISTYASYIGEDKVAAFGKYAAESVNVEFNLPGVKNYDEFMREAQSDPRFAYLIKLLAYSDISGGASLAKNKVTF